MTEDGVQVVARPGAGGLVVSARPVVERRRVGGAPPHGVGRAVVRARHPAAAAADAPSVVAPGLLGSSVPLVVSNSHFFLPGRRVDAEYRAAVRPLAALRADDDGALGVQRGAGETDGQLRAVDQLGLPGDLAGLRVERNQPPVHACRQTPCPRPGRRRGCTASASGATPSRRPVPGRYDQISLPVAPSSAKTRL